MRKIYLSGDIDEAAFREFCEQMDELENDSHAKDVNIILNSIGGNALDAIAISERMRLSPCRVSVTVYGLAGSAAVLILASGCRRRMTKESWLMVHEDSGSYKDMSTSEIEKHAKTARMLENQWAALLEDLTGTDKEKWVELHKSGDLYLSPEECVKLGIADEVI